MNHLIESHGPIVPHPSELTVEIQEFGRWLRTNDNKLRTYAPDQTATLALVCGFPREIVYAGINDQLIHIKRMLTFWESPLAEQWLRMVDYDRGINE
jgi:hypothetical protein